MANHPLLIRLLLALLFTLLNCAKPLQGDEAAYWAVAKRIAGHPLDPYGFQFPGGVPANHVLAPPVLLYWWGAAIHLFGVRPLIWKLWLLPFSLLLVFALDALFRRFCRGLETPLLWLTVLSPAVLPSFSLMLDVPALALSLAAVALFLRASDRASAVGAALAGLVAGLALETKYTAFLTPAVILLYGFLFRRLRLAVLAISVAGLVFAGWEALTAGLYGESHFLHSFRGQPHGLDRPLHLLLPLVSTLGGVAPAIALVGLAALGLSRRGVLAGGAAVLLGYGLIAAVPEEGAAWLRNPPVGWTGLTLNNLVFGAFGMVVCAVVGRTVWRLVRDPRPFGGQTYSQSNRPFPEADSQSGRADWFLVAWLGLELACYFALSPIPAVRRMLGLIVVGTLLVGRLARRTGQPSPRRALVGAVAVGNIALGLGVFAVDLCDADAERVAARQTARLLRHRPRGARAWFAVECWAGFTFYAERAGLRQLGIPGEHPRPGDWLAVMHRPAWRPGPIVSYHWGERVGGFQVEDRLPLRTNPCFYAGRTPVDHHRGSRVEVTIYKLP
jgi:hypothetical protein